MNYYCKEKVILIDQFCYLDSIITNNKEVEIDATNGIRTC